MSNFKISTRLWLLIGFLSLLLAGAGAIGLAGIARTNEVVQTVYQDRMVPIAQISAIQRLLLRNRLLIDHSVINADPAAVTKHVAEVEANIAAVGREWEAYMATTLTPEEAKIAEAFAADRKRFVDEGLRPALAALRAGDSAAARSLVSAKIDPLYEAVGHGIDALHKLQFDVAKAEYDASVARYSTIRAEVVAAVVVGIALASLFGFVLVRSIGGALRHAVEVAQAVAEGDLAHPIRTEGRDEVARLLQAMAAMKERLAQVVGSVRANAESVATASAQIAQGNQDLSQRTEEQASALEQTAASMEELGSTVRQNADNAQQANQLAKGASTVAGEGGQVVADVVQTMKGINDSSRKIADIIGVIDGIAFQTNILALNAAVEAARAGEQGRGFAVVAAEVRNLAQRSAAAAKEIKSLITASVEQVDRGTTLVDKAGETMQQIVGAITRVTDIMSEISAASSEQSNGVAQVGEAVSQMDRATQQNAALVEESAAAAASLKQQAQQLVEAVAVFRLAGPAAAPVAAAVLSSAAAGSPAGGPPPLREPAPARVGAGVKRAAAKTAVGRTAAAVPAAAGGDEGEWQTF